MKSKFLLVITATTLLFSGFSNQAYSQIKKPVVSTKKSVSNDYQQSTEWKNLMIDNLKSSKDLIIMGSKMVSDGNMSNESEKMLMGAKMMSSGLDILKYQMHEYKHSHDKKGQKVPSLLTKDIYSMIDKAVDSSSVLLIRMGNKLVKEGNSGSEGQKMMIGGELINSGINLHHDMEHMKDHKH